VCVCVCVYPLALLCYISSTYITLVLLNTELNENLSNITYAVQRH